MLMTPAALESFRSSSGWEVGANAKVTPIDQGNAADIDAVIAGSAVIAYVSGWKGLMGGPSLEGAEITKLGGGPERRMRGSAPSPPAALAFAAPEM